MHTSGTETREYCSSGKVWKLGMRTLGAEIENITFHRSGQFKTEHAQKYCKILQLGHKKSRADNEHAHIHTF
jgi:hypothetical protein